jgi:hypothetical protein
MTDTTATRDLTAGFSERTQMEVDFTHPWVAEYRVPIVTEIRLGNYWIAALVVPDPNDAYNAYGFQEPDEQDAELIGQYIKYWKSWYGGPYLRKMEERSLDIDSGCNTIVFGKTARSWVYSRQTWTRQTLYPRYDAERQFATLRELMTQERTVAGIANQDFVDFLEKNV